VHVLGADVAGVAAFQYLQDLDPRQRNLEAGVAEFLVFGRGLGHGVFLKVGASGIMLPQSSHATRSPSMRRASLLLLALTLSLAGCFKPEIRQGNLITDEMIAKVKTGMTQPQVMYVMGRPMVQDPFHQSRWD